MSMRKHLRFRAHANMEALGMKHVNRKFKLGSQTGRSFFARTWRKFIRMEDVKQAKRKARHDSA